MPEERSQINKLYGLDHLRALAIIMVFVYHYGRLFDHPEWTYSISSLGWTGVDLFFVLSGYLISSHLFAGIGEGRKISFREFFIKRFFRIIPAYAVVLALYFLFPVLRERSVPAPLWKFLTFTQNIGLDSRNTGAFSHAWSLCIEEQFYLLLPLTLMALVYLKIKKGYWLLVLLFICGIIIRCYCWYHLVAPFAGTGLFWANWQEWIYYPSYNRLDGLVAGVSIAAIFRFRPLLKERLQRHGNLLIVISLLIFTAAFFLFPAEHTFSETVFGFPLVDYGYGLMVIGAISPTSFLYKFKSTVTSYIAALSYAIYLVHKITIHVTQQQFLKLNISSDSNLMLLLCIITSLAGAVILNSLIEKPFLRLRKRILKKEKLLN